MKLLLIAYNEAVEEEVFDLLDANGVANYTKWTKVLGKGTTSGPHLATQVWPKANNVLMIGTENDRAEGVIRSVRRLRETLGHEGVKAFVLPLEAVT